MGPVVAIPGVEVLEELGKRCPGSAFRVRRGTAVYSIEVALLTDGRADQRAAIQRFRRDAIALARIRHPALPRVLEVGERPGAHYAVMELVSGETLAERLRRGPLPESLVVDLGLRITDALARIHENGLVHGNLRTSCVVFDEKDGSVRLTGFDFATQASPRTEGELPLHDSRDPRADIVSLGSVLFECWTGEPLSSAHDPEVLFDLTDDYSAAPGLGRVLARLLGIGSKGYSDVSELRDDLRKLTNPTPLAAHASPLRGSHSASDSAMVGRENELASLRGAWSATETRGVQVALVCGKRGSGKSRLLRAFAEELAEEGCASLVVECQKAREEPYGVVRQLLEVYLDALERLPRALRTEALGRLRALASDVAFVLGPLSPRLGRVLGEVPPRGNDTRPDEVLAEGLGEFLRRVFSNGDRHAVLIDDAQLLDQASRRAIACWMKHSSAPLLFAIGARDDAESWPTIERLIAGIPRDRVWHLPLGALEPLHTAAIAQEYLGAEGVEPSLLAYVATVSDGTPLNLLELLRNLLENGVLVPNWGTWRFDGEAATNADLPRGSLELLQRRISTLSCDAVELLSLAAAAGHNIDPDLLARAAGVPPDRVRALLSDLRGSMLVEIAPGGQRRFVHTAVREALLRRVPEWRLRDLHQAIAEALDAHPHGSPGEATTSPSDNAAKVFALASHYAAGRREKRPERVLATSLAAARLAFERFDNELTLRFFDVAEDVAQRLSVSLDPELVLIRAEAELRAGALERSIERLRHLLESVDSPVIRASALLRIAWAEMQLDTERAGEALSRAFRELGVRPPDASPLSLLVTVLAWITWVLVPRRILLWWSSRCGAESAQKLELLVELNAHACRLAFNSAKPLLLAQAAIRQLPPAKALGTPRALSRSHLHYSFVLCVLGFRRASQRYLTEGRRHAAKSGNPPDHEYAQQLEVVIDSWSGDVRSALKAGERCLDEYGHWAEIGEYCVTAQALSLLEGLRGRNRAAWGWLERVLHRLLCHDGAMVALEYVELSLEAELAALGREREVRTLLARLAEVTTRPVARGRVMPTTYGPRVRHFTEIGALGPEFEAVVDSARGEGFDPRRAPPDVVEYYVHVAHARVHACLRATRDELPGKLRLLAESLSDLKRTARIPLLKAHTAVVTAFARYFEGKPKAARRWFARAEALGRAEEAPWILYQVHRGRAHMLRDQGLEEAALDQARLAVALAEEHGAAHRARFVREEFPALDRKLLAGAEAGVANAGDLSADARASRRRARKKAYLRTLIRIGQRSPRELDFRQQGEDVLDELIEAVQADRGFLMVTRDQLAELDDEASSPDLAETPVEGTASEDDAPWLVPIAARGALGQSLPMLEESELARLAELLEPSDGASDETPLPVVSSVLHATRSVLMAPLVVRGQRVGAVFLDRSLRSGGFDEADAATLTTLSVQVPLVFELARALRARERAEETQRGVEKLEAIARLAGGIAHDFNNMLAVILGASDQILSRKGTKSVDDDVRTIQSAAERARDLTQQLLAFSRGQYLRPEVCQLNELIQRFEPIARQLLGDTRELDLRLAAELCAVKADPAQMNQVLTNLVVNARDAMPEGGRLVIETATVAITQPGEGVEPGRYAQIRVSDTGIGMDADTLAKVFEPFFTTKVGGTGLGLATAYGIVRQSGGHIDVRSEVGRGTTFRILLPETTQHATVATSTSASVPPPSAESPAPPASVQVPATRGGETVLLVDDEPLVREATRRALRSLGYQVLAARNAEEALHIAANETDEIALVITDVIMPGMNGPDLARELGRIKRSFKVLFMSGYTAGVLAEHGLERDSVDFLQKPVPRDLLASRIRELLGSGGESQQALN